ncbi:hypothetical protein DAI22_09g085900 [Oryza sativa Japonica Group]|jgi:hypothetical protein|nr:hypothetical protein DAI22_09g085900 [Oryza sativa Japonica Group]
MIFAVNVLELFFLFCLAVKKNCLGMMKTGFVTRYCYGLWAILLVQLCLPCLSWLTLMLFFLHSSVIDSSFVLSVDLVSSDKNIIVAAWFV